MPNEKWIYLDLSLEITVSGPLHIGTGYGRGLVDRTVVHDGQGDVYIPGSSLKGKARNACEDLARRSGLGVCGLPRVAEAPGDASHNPEHCLVCRVFGNPGGNDPLGRGLFWQDAHLREGQLSREAPRDRGRPWKPEQTPVRTQVQLSRARGVAADDRLYTSESALAGLTFAGRVGGWLKAVPCSVATGYHEVNLLLAGLRLVEMLGGERSRGAGRCLVTLPDSLGIRVETQTDPSKYAPTDLIAASEWLGFFPEDLKEGGE